MALKSKTERTKPYDAVIDAFVEWQASNLESVQKMFEFAKSFESELKKPAKFLATITSPQNQSDREREILSAFKDLMDPTRRRNMYGDKSDTAELLDKLVKEKKTEVMLLAIRTDFGRYRKLQKEIHGLYNAYEKQDVSGISEYLSLHQLVIENYQQFPTIDLLIKATLSLRIMFLLAVKNKTLRDDENLSETENANHELTSDRIKKILEDFFENDMIKAEQLAKFWPSEIQEAALEEVMEIVSQLKPNLKRWAPHRLETVKCLREMSEDLHTHNKNVAISQTVASGTSILATVLGVTGLALTPLTLGASLGLTITGAALGGASAITHIGSTVTKHAIDETKQKRLKELEKKEEAELEGTKDQMRKRVLKVRLFKLHAWVQDHKPGTFTNETNDTGRDALRVKLPVGSSLARASSGALRVGVKAAGAATKVASRVALGVGGALSVLTLPLDITNIVLLASELKSGAKCATGEEFARIADKYEAEGKSIQNLIEYYDVISKPYMRLERFYYELKRMCGPYTYIVILIIIAFMHTCLDIYRASW